MVANHLLGEIEKKLHGRHFVRTGVFFYDFFVCSQSGIIHKKIKKKVAIILQKIYLNLVINQI